MKKILILITLTFNLGCSAMNHKPSNKKLDLEKFMGNWYVQKGRVTFLEAGAHNPLETYTWNESKSRVDIGFTFNKDSFEGKQKQIPQKGYIQNSPINTHWKVSPIWPIKLDYLVIDFASDYSWTAIGVPSGKYLWIMTREKHPNAEVMSDAIDSLKRSNYPLHKLEDFRHKQ
tara:strand:- start:142 stop:660 length:519 start_codon:yes stop_codon:yes gene_type:complete